MGVKQEPLGNDILNGYHMANTFSIICVSILQDANSCYDFNQIR